MTQKINFHSTSSKRQVLIALIILMTLALAISCTPARQMATRTTTPEKTAEIDQNLESPETETADIEKEAPIRKQRMLPTPFKTAANEQSEISEKNVPKEEEEILLANNSKGVPSETLSKTQLEKQPSSHAHARLAQNETNEKLEKVLTQLVEQHETIIHLMQEQMTAQKEIVQAAPSTHAPIENDRQEYREDELYEEPAPAFAQKTVLEESVNSHEVRVSISPELSIVLDEELLIEWENTVTVMERGGIPRTKLPAWILQGLEWLTHAPSHEPERSQILMPLYRHMQYAGHLSNVNMNSMSPADVVRILRVFVNEMKERKGQIHKA